MAARTGSTLQEGGDRAPGWLRDGGTCELGGGRARTGHRGSVLRAECPAGLSAGLRCPFSGYVRAVCCPGVPRHLPWALADGFHRHPNL